MITWRKGLRWNKALSSWVSVATGRPFTARGLQRRKAMAKAGTLKLAKVQPKKRKPKPNPKPKPKAKVKAKAKAKAKPRSKRDKAYAAIEEMMNKAKAKLAEQGYVVDARLHRNRDGSLDSELRVMPKRGQQVNDIFIDMEQDVRAVPNTWVSTGIRYMPRETEESGVPGDFNGLSRINSYYQRNTPRKLATNFVTGREINRRVGEKKFRKAEHVVMKVHWNPKNTKPDRDET